MLLRPLLFLIMLSAACVYNAPPEVTTVLPEEGIYRVGDTILLRFSEPIAHKSLAIKVWSGERSEEGELLKAGAPLRDVCKPHWSPCDTTLLELVYFDEKGSAYAVDGTQPANGARLFLDPSAVGQPNRPLVIEVLAGLSDLEGAESGVSTEIDVQFYPDGAAPNGGPVAFHSGTYVLVVPLEEPMPVTLTLIGDFVAREDGSWAFAAGEGDTLGDAPADTVNPHELEVDATDRGFTAYLTGTIIPSGEERILESTPTDLSFTLGSLAVSLSQIKLVATVVEDPSTGGDRIEGTFSYAGASLDMMGQITEYAAGSTPFQAVYAPPADAPAGHPTVCGDLCGVVPDQCHPPASFPPDGFCATEGDSP